MALIFAMILTVLMIMVMITDFTRFTIPNRLVLAFLVVYPIMLVTLGGRPEWYYDLAIGAGMFLLGFVIFSLKLMGGGDVKLLAASSLFIGKEAFLSFVIGVALWGGALALGLLVAREIVPYIYMKLGKKPESIPKVFTAGQPAPYGLAIAASFLMLLWAGQLPSLKL